MLCRFMSLGVLEINITIMMYGSLMWILVLGLNLIYGARNHKGGFLIQLWLQTWILPSMEGNLVLLFVSFPS